MIIMYFLLLFAPFHLISEQLESNVLIYKESVEVNAEINANDVIIAGQPIVGSILITHNIKSVIDPNSFKIQGKPLNSKFVRTVPMTASGDEVISIYQFQVAGVSSGTHILGNITVTISGIVYTSPQLSVEVN